MSKEQKSWIAFAGSCRVAIGTPHQVAAAVKSWADANAARSVLVFDRSSSEPVELDLRGTADEVLARLPLPPDSPAPEASATEANEMPVATRSAGRPRLGVVAREVTLLPRHWTWLASQSGGASVALRKLVEQAIRSSAVVDRVRKARESTYRFMTAIAGNETNHEEAIRALFAGDLTMFATLIERWPADIREHLLFLAHSAELEQ